MRPAHVLTLEEILIRLAVGALLGVCIGIERQWRGAAAGIQTSSLVCTGATLYSTIGPALGSDDIRIIAGIVTGCGFLAGGVILREGLNVSGLNTAATIWATAAIGALCGAGLLYEGAIAAVAIVAINTVFLPLINWMDKQVMARRPLRNTASDKTAP
jgi:putative Mg2+ transporter-C (MgtC) family protein